MQIRGSLYYNGQKKFFGEGKTLIADSLEAEISCKRYSCGAVYAFRPEQCETETVTLALAGIDKNADYLLTYIDESFCRTEKTCSGEELLSGIRLTINDTRKSLIMKYKKL